MPTYQYRCKECAHELEVVQSFSDDPLESCPECQGRLKKVYGNVGISFKGSGFYKTDSRSPKKSSSASTSSTDTAGKSSEPSTKADAPAGDKQASTPASSPSTSSTDKA
ncbi:MAG: FmdB family zinc ribbon protein [Acidimicrobiales bacterium]